MKRLISAADVERAAAAHENLVVDSNTLVTPQAKDVARELGVELCTSCEASSQACSTHTTCAPAPVCESSQASECACKHAEKNCDAAPALSAEEMEKFLRAALAAGVWTESELRALVDKIKRSA